ncbi:MAG: hypothetical protein Q4G40_11685, partial [Brachybacterium sp.]|nr:hypothetical protein [Brachybacterium sp.]
TTPEETTPEETATDEGDISAEDEQAAKERMVEFIDTTFSGDYEGACTMIMNPMTNEPMSGSEASDCADGMSQSAGDETMEDMVGVITPDMIDMTPLDDGRLEASFPGSTETFTLIKGDDGQWYIDGAELM